MFDKRYFMAWPRRFQYKIRATNVGAPNGTEYFDSPVPNTLLKVLILMSAGM
jgi:hypothetical protein